MSVGGIFGGYSYPSIEDSYNSDIITETELFVGFNRTCKVCKCYFHIYSSDPCYDMCDVCWYYRSQSFA